HLNPGAPVQCPKCRIRFPVPPPQDEDDPPPPIEPVRRADLDGFSEAPGGTQAGRDRRAEEEPDRDDRVSTGWGEEPRSDGVQSGGAQQDEAADSGPPRSADLDQLASEYRVDLGAWFSLARDHWGAILGQAIGFLLIYVITVAVVGGVFNAMVSVA